MAVKPISLRQLEEHFVCQYRTHGDEMPAPQRKPDPRPQRTEQRRRRPLLDFLRR